MVWRAMSISKTSMLTLYLVNLLLKTAMLLKILRVKMIPPLSIGPAQYRHPKLNKGQAILLQVIVV